MTSVISDAKSDASRDILENLTKKSDTNKYYPLHLSSKNFYRLYQMEAKITESMLTSAWTGFGNLLMCEALFYGNRTLYP